ncbi:MAG TPA: restriction endonuclease subunit M [Phycisphaerales bacterium]|mgnify:CR=1 FL=1|nr:restriction endonuclease subunit M [Phycisphaerales bacterium]
MQQSDKQANHHKTVPQPVLDLIARFAEHATEYRAARYNETQSRREFIDPLFKALGWDMDNNAGYAEAYKDVIHEDAIKIGGATKAPDYCFRIGGIRKFFVEAKKPSVDIKGDASPAYQLRRYAWSAKLPLSILTDFEELAVYDCRFKPIKSDRASKARILFFRYDELAERWNEFAAIFARESILMGSFDKYAESSKNKRGTDEVDDAFLAEIEDWRDKLARNLALRNNNLAQRDLNFAVQRTIDRIVFLRICEDRGIEQYGTLQELTNGDKIYERLFERFRRADERYNSGLFHFSKEKSRSGYPDDLTPSLIIDDKPLKEILRRLYYPDCPYEFSVLPADILGHVYEQFLGKVIRLTSGHRAVVEEKPEVRKAGGVYYTPTYIVEYIVKQTVGKLIEGKSPQEVGALTTTFQQSKALGARALAVLDPACGSGSFLLIAYQFLLDWYRDWYIGDDPRKHTVGKNPRLYQHSSGEYRLTTAERKRILLTHIHGVDIDSQAVETTKLSLLLKVLEGESAENLDSSLRLFHERALPDLANNIKCGNSLIDQDFYDASGEQMGMFDEDQRLKINVFNWKTEFSDIMMSGGFDAVIGNPPYIFTRELLTLEERKYFTNHYPTSFEKHNTYLLFMEAMLRLLVNTGLGAFIVPNSWLTIESAKLLRAKYLSHLHEIIDLNYEVFRRVSMEPCIYVVSGNDSTETVKVNRVGSREEFISTETHEVDRQRWMDGDGRFSFSTDSAVSNVILAILARTQQLDTVFDVRTGLQAYERGKGVPPQSADDVKNHIYDRNERENEFSYRYLQGGDVGRYSFNWSGMWMQYGPWLSQPREISMFTRPRVLLREITSPLPHCLNAVFVDEPFLSNKSVLTVLHEDDDKDALLFLCAILNSNLISLFYKQMAVKSSRKIFPKVVIRNLREFPLPPVARNSKVDKWKQVSSLARIIINLFKSLPESKTAHAKTSIQRQIDATERQINNLVYELYGLTSEEMRIVNAAMEK